VEIVVRKTACLHAVIVTGVQFTPRKFTQLLFESPHLARLSGQFVCVYWHTLR